MTFLWPQLLWALCAVPLLVVVYVWLLRRKKKLVLRFASVDLIRQAMGTGTLWRRHVPPALFLLAMAAGILAAARPTAVVSLPSNHATVMLVVDVSLSMLATDIKPNRITAAQAAAKSFLTDLPRNVKVGIVTFAGSAQVVQPATLQREDLLLAIDKFQLQRGTAVGSGIVVALSELFPDHGIDVGEMIYGNSRRGKSIDEAPAKPKKDFVPVAPGSYTSAAMVLLTDGRRTTGVDPLEAAKMAADRGIRVYAIGLGTTHGEIPGFDGWSAFLKLDEPSLKAIAGTTRAEYFYADNADALKTVYQNLSTRLQVDKQETELSAMLALVAAVLALGAAALSLLWFNRIV
ncbi:MAG: VWA domain-containing protein [Burkholderiaceae bacterium]